MWLLFIVTIFWLVRNTIWSSLIHFDPFSTDLIDCDKKELKLKIWWYISMIISSEIKFDQVWSNLIDFGQIWFDLIKKWKSYDTFQWLFHQKLKKWKKWKIWAKKIDKSEKSILRAFARTRAKKIIIFLAVNSTFVLKFK